MADRTQAWYLALVGVIAAVALSVSGLPPAVAANSNSCRCLIHPAFAEGDGTCSVSDTDKRCRIYYRATLEEDYQTLVEALKQAGIDQDPREALAAANDTSPLDWTEEFIEKNLPALAGISLKADVLSSEGERATTIKELASIRRVIQQEGDSISKLIRMPQSAFDPQELIFEGMTTRIGFGCIEFVLDRAEMMVKAAISEELANELYEEEAANEVLRRQRCVE